jgi:alpha,alpha-trehalase
MIYTFQYDVSEFGSAGGGGEYNVQVGFGWTNGVILMMLEQYDQFYSTV